MGKLLFPRITPVGRDLCHPIRGAHSKRGAPVRCARTHARMREGRRARTGRGKKGIDKLFHGAVINIHGRRWASDEYPGQNDKSNLRGMSQRTVLTLAASFFDIMHKQATLGLSWTSSPYRQTINNMYRCRRSGDLIFRLWRRTSSSSLN